MLNHQLHLLALQKNFWRKFLASLLFVFTLLLSLGCGGGQPITPLNEPIFRLNTTVQASDCDKDKTLPCRWNFKGTINSFSVVAEGENPFRDCQNCHFNQKFGLEDTNGTIHFVYYRLPTDEAIFLTQGMAVELTFVDASNLERGYAISLRKVGEGLVFAAANGAGGHYLTPELLRPLEIKADLDNVAGKQNSECGTKVFRFINFTLGGKRLQLAPGKTALLENGQGLAYRVANVNIFTREGLSQCKTVAEPPFAFFALLNQGSL